MRGLEGWKGWENTLSALPLAVVTSLYDHLCTLAQYCLLCDPSLGLGRCIPFLFVVVRLWMVCTVSHLILWRNLIDMNAPELLCCSAILRCGKLAKMTSGYFQKGTPLITHSKVLSTFQYGGWVKFPTMKPFQCCTPSRLYLKRHSEYKGLRNYIFEENECSLTFAFTVKLLVLILY